MMSPKITMREAQEWLVQRLAAETGLNPDEIDVDGPLQDFGLSSREAVVLSGDLEQWLDRRLAPTIVWEYPTIARLARYLAETSGESAAQPPLPPPAPLRAPSEEQTEIAIVGMGCRFPGAAGPAAFWQLLVDGVDAIREVPPDRWDADAYYDPNLATPGKMNTRWGGFLEQIDQFDAAFFGIPPHEAERMDPQQRLVLEVAWEALEQAGQAVDQLAGSNTGVFIGVSASDYALGLFDDPTAVDVYSGTGGAHSIVANRLSYLLDLRGPSVAVDTACSSSLVAVHLACQSLRSGECATALAGGVNVLLAPELTVAFAQGLMMAADGRCKTFDAAADGYVRSEGCGVVVLKRLADAQRAGDPVWAVIHSSAVNQDGRSNGLTAPNGQAQQAVIRQALAAAELPPAAIGFVETHGTGTPLGDPIEVDALRAVFAPDRPADHALALGSVKTNIGHLEAAAGVAGLIKAALAVQQGVIPPHLHLRQLNPLITLGAALTIPTTPQPWPGTPAAPRLAGVSSFGFGGTNAHVIVGQAPATPGLAATGAPAPARTAWLLPLSARSPAALHDLAASYARRLQERPEAPLTNFCATAGRRRAHQPLRLAVVGQSAAELTTRLLAWSRDEIIPGVVSGKAAFGQPPRVAFIFPGQGAQWAGMGRQLLRQEPAFQQAMARCAEALQPYVAWSLLDVLGADDPAWLERIDIVQPALWAMQVALAAVWRAWGVEPGAVLGHSMGEAAAAYVAGALSLADAAHVICLRSRLMRQVSGRGAMAMVGLALPQAEAAIAGAPGVSVAVSNGPTATVLSGDPAALAALVAELAAQGVFCRPVKVDVAAHSVQMEPLQPALVQGLADLRPTPTALPFYSTVTAAPLAGEALTAAYWGRNLRAPVLFAATLEKLLTDGYDTFVEISPHPILTLPAQELIAQRGGAGRIISTLRRQPSDAAAPTELALLYEALGALYAAGYPVRWQQVYPEPLPVAPLPTYPWQRQRFWTTASRQRPASGAAESAQPGSAPGAPRTAAPESWLLQATWLPVPPPAGAATGETQPPGTWLILAEGEAVGPALAAQLQARGQRPVTARPGPAFQRLAAASYEVNPASEADLRRLLAEITQPEDMPLRGVVCLWGLAPTDAQHDLTASLTATLRALLALLRALTGLADRPALWLVTRGGQVVGRRAAGPDLAQTPLWGLGRVIALEHPELWGGLVDLDPVNSNLPAETATLAEVMLRPDAETQIALRGDQRFGLRLMRPGSAVGPAVTIRSDAAYLITGGLGELGLHIAHWLVQQGARHLILVGRSPWPPTGTANPDRTPDPRIAAVQALAAAGATVAVATLDVTQGHQLADWLDAFRRTQPETPIRGVVHAAGVLCDRLLTELSDDDLTAVLAPKIAGAWALHTAFSNAADLDFFVLFSSATALLGLPGQGNYAAANAFLDGLAHARRAAGLPGLSIQWGPWAEGGLAVRSGADARLAQFGVQTIPPAQGTTLFGRLAATDAATIAVIPAHWDRVAEALATLTRRPPHWLNAVRQPAAAAAPAQPPGEPPLPTERAAPTLASSTDLTAYLQARIGHVLYLPAEQIPVDRHLLELGVDSLMAMELIRGLERDYGLRIYPREVLEQPDIATLATYLAAEVARRAGPAHAAQAAPHPPTERQGASVETPRPPTTSRGDGLLSLLAGDAPRPLTVTQRNGPVAFVLSSPRSGSTLLRVMLAGHPDLFSPPELNLLPFNRMLERRQALGASYLDEGLHRAFVELLNLDAAQSTALVDDLVARDAPVPEVYTWLQKLAAPRLLVDKSPSYASSLETLRRAEALFDGAKYVLLTRHPYAVIESFVRNRFERLLGVGDADPLTIAEMVWATTNANALDFLASVEPARRHIVRYEDLVREPQRVAQALCSFLGVPYDPALLHPYQGDRMADGLHSTSLPIGDPNFLSHSDIDPTLADVWRTVELPRSLGPLARRVAAELGYELPHEGAPDNRPATRAPALKSSSPAAEEISAIVPLQPLGDKPPLFFVHPASGIVYPYYELARALGVTRPFYALQDTSFAGTRKTHSRLEEYATEYIPAMRSIQPKGPYCLGGWSFGGHVAVEMARQLLAQGEQVAMLLVLDTEAPVDFGTLNPLNRLKYLKNKAMEYINVATGIFPYIRDGLYLLSEINHARLQRGELKLSPAAYARWAWTDAMQRKMAGDAQMVETIDQRPEFRNIRLPTDSVLQVLNMVRRHMAVVRRSAPRPYNGAMVFLRASEQVHRQFYTTEALGWETLVEGRIDIHVLPGNHISIFHQPNVAIMAATIQACMAQAEAIMA